MTTDAKLHKVVEEGRDFDGNAVFSHTKMELQASYKPIVPNSLQIFVGVAGYSSALANIVTDDGNGNLHGRPRDMLDEAGTVDYETGKIILHLAKITRDVRGRPEPVQIEYRYDVADDPRNPITTDNKVVEKAKDSAGNVVFVHSEATTYKLQAADKPIVPGSLRITIPILTKHDLLITPVAAVTDDENGNLHGRGYLVGTGDVGTVDYETGEITLHLEHTTAQRPAVPMPIALVYRHTAANNQEAKVR